MPEPRDCSLLPKPSAKRYERTLTLQPSLRSTLVSYHNGRICITANYLQTTPVHKAAASFDKPSIILAPSNVPPVMLKPDQSDTAMVLIKVKLDDNVPPNLDEWRNLLRRQIPTNVAKI